MDTTRPSGRWKECVCSGTPGVKWNVRMESIEKHLKCRTGGDMIYDKLQVICIKRHCKWTSGRIRRNERPKRRERERKTTSYPSLDTLDTNDNPESS